MSPAPVSTTRPNRWRPWSQTELMRARATDANVGNRDEPLGDPIWCQFTLGALRTIFDRAMKRSTSVQLTPG
jgi:hypothetical protein